MIHSIRNWNANAACVHVVIGCKKARVLPFRRLIMSRMQSQRRQVKFRWTQFTLVERKGKSMSMILIMCAVSPPVLHPEVVPSKNCDSRLSGWSPKSSQHFDNSRGWNPVVSTTVRDADTTPAHASTPKATAHVLIMFQGKNARF